MPPKPRINLLKGVAYVTGAGSGIGQHTAYSLARHGVRQITITDLQKQGLEETELQLKIANEGIEVQSLIMDVSDEAAVERSIRDTVKAFGRLDFTVNNAGIGGPSGPMHEVEKKDWEKLMEVNLTGVFLCMKHQIRQMLNQEIIDERQGRGAIVNLSSMLGRIGTSEKMPVSAYVSSKHAVIGLTRTESIFYGPHSIRINAICPGYVETPLLNSTNNGIFRKLMNEEIAKTPLKRLAKMEEIGDSVTYMLSPMASFMTGATVVVDGGYTVQ